jgi:hypothetical protein
MQQDPELELQYKTCYARVLDAKRQFLNAAARCVACAGAGIACAWGASTLQHGCVPCRYYELSSAGTGTRLAQRVDKDELVQVCCGTVHEYHAQDLAMRACEPFPVPR